MTNIINGTEEDDILRGTVGVDVIYGHGGNDYIQADGDTDTVYGGDGDDTVIGGDDEDIVHGDAGNDWVRGGFGDDMLYGGDGDDRVEGGRGNDYLEGGAGNDLLFGDDGVDTIYGGAGDDKARGGDGNDTVHGGDGNDILFGNDGDDIVNGDAGNDILWGGQGSDTLRGGEDNDSLWGEDGADFLYGDNGEDALHGGAGNDYLDGGYDNDRLFGGDGNDHLIGDDGTDPNAGSGSSSDGGVRLEADGPAVHSATNSGWTTTTVTIDGVPFVVTTQFGYSGTTIISRVETDGTLTETDRLTYNNSTQTVVSASAGDITSQIQDAGLSVGAFGNGLHHSNISVVDGTPTLFLTSQNSGSITTLNISPEGTLSLEGGLSYFGGSQTWLRDGIIRENVVFEANDGSEYVYVTRPFHDRVDILTYDPTTGAMAETGKSVTAGDIASSIDIIEAHGQTFAVASGNASVHLYSVNEATGDLTAIDTEAVTNGSGNSVNFYQTADGTTYAITSSSGGDYASVFELNADGSLTRTDTVDGGGAYMSTAGYVEGQPVFVMPNATEGVDLYTIDENGQLVLRTTITDLQNDYTPPVIVQTTDGSYFLVDADGQSASVKLAVDDFLSTAVNDLLVGGNGDDLLEGGAGDDLLFGNADNDKLYGGDGNDVLKGDDGVGSEMGLFQVGGAVDNGTNYGWTTTAIEIDGVPYVLTTSFGYSGSAILSRVENDGSLTETDRMTFNNSTQTVTTTSSGDITAQVQDAGLSVGAMGNGLTQSNMAYVDGQATLFLTSQNSGSITTWHISDDGKLSLDGGLSYFGGSQTWLRGGIVRENEVFEANDGTEYLYVTRSQNDRIDILTYDSDTGKITETGKTVAAGDLVSGLDIISMGAQTFLASSANGSLNLYAVSRVTGDLTLVDTQTVTAGGGNSVNFYQTADGAAYAITSGNGADYASIFKVGENGTLTLTDTISGGGAYMSSAGYVDGEPVFVMPNATEGVDLYTIDNDGKFEHQLHVTGIENDKTPPVIVQTKDGSYFLVDADGNAASVELGFGYDTMSIEGYTNDDELYGGAGNDQLEGNHGNDKLDGGEGNDILQGNDGADFLTGGSGFDTLTGGKHADVFFFDSESGSDTITDFNLREDSIQIDSSLANSADALTYWQSGANTVVSVNDGAATITLENFDVDRVTTDMFDFV
ncbi:calcium-binding protein [Enterovibrio nigricans]|uniref:Hemolysin-type calcium-binding repeat-containing protein n=1 Tax=Enterovibrio nigricans DSM 22720 TaxID=1121868 RepID=A0A1T4UZL2_9GAMM|nr:alkaline phosphatase [Enterovibrio nigricans]SKA58058.1 Hemolysin-type calcium-binding repeat-containing protein [Enterovibrio nigricans DSM 22720]